MDKITKHSLNRKTVGQQFNETLWNIPQLLRDFKTLKTNYYYNVMLFVFYLCCCVYLV